MNQNEYLRFLNEHNVKSISQLGKTELLKFVDKFMDEASSSAAKQLLDNPFGQEPDWTEAAKAVETAFLSGKTFCYGFITGESYSPDKASSPRLEYFAR